MGLELYLAVYEPTAVECRFGKPYSFFPEYCLLYVLELLFYHGLL